MDSIGLPEGFVTDPVLVGPGMELRPLVEADRGAVMAAAGDPGIWAGHPVPDRHRPEVFGPYLDWLLQVGGTLVARDPGGRVIGMSRYYASVDAPDGICIGYTFLVRDYWGGAGNFEMKRLMLEHLFGHVGEAWLHIAPSNIRSQKATAKLGAERMENAVLDHGTGPEEWVRMRLSRAAWQWRLSETG